jgi:hypothetical protein
VDLPIEIGERVAEVLIKNGMFLDWTMLKACLKDQQVLQCIDMKLCDNEENNY